MNNVSTFYLNWPMKINYVVKYFYISEAVLLRDINVCLEFSFVRGSIPELWAIEEFRINEFVIKYK